MGLEQITDEIGNATGFYTTNETEKIDKKYKPNEIKFGRYFLPNNPVANILKETFKEEAIEDSDTLSNLIITLLEEDVTARIVEASIKHGKWVGMAYKNLAEQLHAEIQAIRAQKDKATPKKYNNITDRIKDTPDLIKTSYNKTVARIKSFTEPDSYLAQTLYFSGDHAPSALGKLLKDMVDKGFFDLKHNKEEEAILIPTYEFIGAVYKAQQV